MEVKEAKEQLLQVSSYFRGYELEIVEKERNIAPRLKMVASDIITYQFLIRHSDLMSAAISCLRTIAIEHGKRIGIVTGKNIRSAEFRELLNLDKDE